MRLLTKVNKKRCKFDFFILFHIFKEMIAYEKYKSTLDKAGLSKIQLVAHEKQTVDEVPNKKPNRVVVEDQRKLSGALLVAPGGGILKVGHSLSRTEKSIIF